MITTLRIKKKYDSSLDLAVKWYSIISILNNFYWSPLETKLIAFIAIKGDISSGGRKEAFCEWTGSTKASVANIISKLSKGLAFLVKTNGRIKVHPELLINFEGDVFSQLILEHVREK